MPKICLMEFDKGERHFQFLKEVELLSVPTSGDKVIIEIDGIGYIFKVYDVHFAENLHVDINIIRISTITEYNSSNFLDII